ncbi:MAG: hypothetical protein LBF88_06340 [Planctomycetaceae bacterium]|jgi:hypothetical protein|nr:hypothetical protein [Planctomycetaceae bacterium]
MFRCQLFIVVSLFICCFGCFSGDGLNRAAVEGTVTLDNKPLEKGFISWFPLNREGPTVGADIQNGKYKLNKKNGPVVGEYRVTINGQPVPTGKKIPSSMNPAVMEDELMDPVPAKYRSDNAGTMGQEIEPVLKATVVTGKNVIDFSLDSQ